jgi:cytochrome c-type biogenesis protein CcsB
MVNAFGSESYFDLAQQLENFFSNFSFLILFIAMLIYWIQASNYKNQNEENVFKEELGEQGNSLKKVENLNFLDYFNNFFNYLSNERNIGIILTSIANISLFFLLILRWFESGHFPLSNLYESLMFLSWSLTMIHLFIEFGFSSKTDKELENNTISSPILSSSQLSKEWKKETSPFLVEGSGIHNSAATLSLEGKVPALIPLLCKEEPLALQRENRTKSLDHGNKEGEGKDMLTRSYSYTNLMKKGSKMMNESSIKLVGSIIAPCALFTNAFATFSLPKEMQEASPLVPALQSNWLMMHVTVMILSYAALIFGSLLSIGFLVITEFPSKNSSVLPNKYKSNLARILDNLSYRVLGFGFPLLTIGILSGAVWANEAWGSYWSWDPKETWALLTWLVFAIYLHTRLTKGWEGKKPALIASLGFITVWICFLGVNLIGEGLHSYGWINF